MEPVDCVQNTIVDPVHKFINGSIIENLFQCVYLCVCV